MAKVVRKSQKSEATAEKNHQNQKVSMNEPFSKTGAQKLDILQWLVFARFGGLQQP